MASIKKSAFKTPQKGSDCGSTSKLSRSPLANIQVISMVNASQCKSASPVRFLTQNNCTPPRPFFKIRNPFERTLVESLHTPICSPGMFKIKESSGSFKWDIEHVSLLKPADIVVCNSQFEPTPDPILEKKATEAIDKFFSQEMIVPSPFDEAPKRNIHLPMDPEEDQKTTPEGVTKCSFREAWSQTILTIPAILPPEIENALKPFYTFTKDQNILGDPDISANGSLRRKLCFEETFSDSDDDPPIDPNLFQPSFNSPCVPQNALLRGLKRTFDTPKQFPSLGNVYAGNIQREVEAASSGIGSAQNMDLSNVDNSNFLKSPSFSPIKQYESPEEKEFTKISSVSPSLQSDIHHSCHASPFSQSTPEKSSQNSLNNSTKSSPDSLNTCESGIKAFHNKSYEGFKFSYDISDLIKGDLKMDKRSQSEISVNSLGRSRSAMKLDFSMDVSGDLSMHLIPDHSLRSHSVLGGSSESNISGTHHHVNCWDMEMVQYNIEKNNALHDKYSGDMTTISFDCKNILENTNFHNAEETFDSEKIVEVCQYLTPTKNLLSKNSFQDIINRSCERKSVYTVPSPMEMSLENSFNFETDKISIKESQPLGDLYIVKTDDLRNSVASYSLHAPFDTKEIDSKLSCGFTRMDSGYNENFCTIDSQVCHGDRLACNTKTCNSTKHFCQSDITKSFNCNVEASSTSWKRFDSGFNDETSDGTHHLSCIENSKQAPKKCMPLVEYSDDNKENIYFNDHKITAKGPVMHDSLSVSDIFADDMVSFNCNFSSTPSKTNVKKY